MSDGRYFNLAAVDTRVKRVQKFGDGQSLKPVSELFAPISGDVVERNEELLEQPERVNAEPYGDGWLFKVRMADRTELNNLLSAQAYREHAGVDA